VVAKARHSGAAILPMKYEGKYLTFYEEQLGLPYGEDDDDA
jgi:hypothetical protein